MRGGMLASQHFVRLAAALSDAFTLYISDRRGRGLSSPHGHGYCIAKECVDLEALLAATRAQNVFGLSSAAIISLLAAKASPGDLQSRTL